jgi:hypothetical protein
MKIIRESNPSIVTVEGVDYGVLPLEFSESGLYYTQVKREEDVCMYEVRDELGSVMSYEVIRVRRQKGRVGVLVGGCSVDFKSKETYPSDEQFGILGRSFVSKEKAELVFLDVVAWWKEHDIA